MKARDVRPRSIAIAEELLTNSGLRSFGGSRSPGLRIGASL